MSPQTFIDEADHMAEIRRQIKRFVAAEAPAKNAPCGTGNIASRGTPSAAWRIWA